MKLTSLCKLEFEKWYKNKNYKINYTTDEDGNTDEWDLLYNNVFKNLPLSMQWGVFKLFFDSVGLELVEFKWRGKHTASVYLGNEMKISSQIGKDKGFKTPQEAWKFAVEKADRIRNEQLN